MINLLKLRIPVEYGIAPTNVVLNYKTSNNKFQLYDKKACSNCSSCALCNKEVLIVEPNNVNVNIIDFENFANSLPSFKKRCDYIMYEDSDRQKKITFCDLTCTNIKYIGSNPGSYPQGKRAHAYMQMKESIEQLLKIDLINQYILTCVTKECVLGWKETSSPTQNKANKNISSFIKTPSSMAKQLTCIVDHGFLYKTIKYNTVYTW